MSLTRDNHGRLPFRKRESRSRFRSCSRSFMAHPILFASRRSLVLVRIFSLHFGRSRIIFNVLQFPVFASGFLIRRGELPLRSGVAWVCKPLTGVFSPFLEQHCPRVWFSRLHDVPHWHQHTERRVLVCSNDDFLD